MFWGDNVFGMVKFVLRMQVQLEHLPYSRGIRQRLAIASKKEGWLEKYRIVVGG